MVAHYESLFITYTVIQNYVKCAEPTWSYLRIHTDASATCIPEVLYMLYGIHQILVFCFPKTTGELKEMHIIW
jgi:hypothetical protein